MKSDKDDIPAADIVAACERFLDTWDRHEWMQTYGEWASSGWDPKREEYSDAHEELQQLLVSWSSPERPVDPDELREAAEALALAAEALKDQVRSDESDYIETGTIEERDGLADECEYLGIGVREAGWECMEGWGAHRAGSALVLNWWRTAYYEVRHDRDLWVVVDDGFFEEGE